MPFFQGAYNQNATTKPLTLSRRLANLPKDTVKNITVELAEYNARIHQGITS